jgi:hypothetical protein
MVWGTNTSPNEQVRHTPSVRHLLWILPYGKSLAEQWNHSFEAWDSCQNPRRLVAIRVYTEVVCGQELYHDLQIEISIILVANAEQPITIRPELYPAVFFVCNTLNGLPAQESIVTDKLGSD